MKIVQHFKGDDRGDYTHVTIEVCGKVMAEYGDFYHEKGHLMAEAFVHGWYRGRAMNYEEPEREKRVY